MVAALVTAAALVARGVLAALICAAGWAVVPQLLGATTTAVMSGSMAPRVQVGDAVVSVPTARDSLHPGAVLLVDDPDHHGRLRLHRLVDVDAYGVLTLKGDANRGVDSSRIGPDAVRGVALLRVPGVALPVVWARTGRWTELILTVAALTGLTALARLGNRGGTRPLVRRGRRRRAAVVAAGVAGALAVVPAAPSGSWAAYAATTSSPVGTFTTPSCFAAFTPVDSPTFTYAFAEPTASATVLDSTANNRTGVLRGTASRSGSCASGDEWLTLDGSAGGFAVYPVVSSPSAGPTLELWFRTTTPGGVLIDLGDAATGSSTTTERVLSMTSTGGLVFTTGGTAAATSGVALADGRWHLVDVRLSSIGNRRIYVDGTLRAQVSGDPAPAASGYWRFGGDADGWFHGDLDDLAVYPTALSNAQITDHSSRGR